MNGRIGVGLWLVSGMHRIKVISISNPVKTAACSSLREEQIQESLILPLIPEQVPQCSNLHLALRSAGIYNLIIFIFF